MQQVGGCAYYADGSFVCPDKQSGNGTGPRVVEAFKSFLGGGRSQHMAAPAQQFPPAQQFAPMTAPAMALPPSMSAYNASPSSEPFVSLPFGNALRSPGSRIM